jgi:transposase
MLIIGCDFHTRYQQVAVLDTETGEMWDRRVEHEGGQVQVFYAELARPVRVGMEATGHAQWFERLLDRMGHELWVGDPAQIRAAAVRQQKTDTRDARHLLQLVASGRFPRVWVPCPAERDARQLLLHRHKLVQQRSRVKHQLQALALGQGLCQGSGLWSRSGLEKLRALELDPWAKRRRDDLLALLEQLDPVIAELEGHVQAAAAQRPEARALQQQRGVGPVTALAYVLTLGTVERFRSAKQVVSYLGLNPRESSSGGKQRLGGISKQGNGMLRWLLVEAGQSAARHDEELRRQYRRLAMRRGRNIAKVAVARKLAVRLYWRWRKLGPATPPARTPGSPELSVVNAGGSSKH